MKVFNLLSAVVCMTALTQGIPVEVNTREVDVGTTALAERMPFDLEVREAEVSITDIRDWCRKAATILGQLSKIADALANFLDAVNNLRTCAQQIGTEHDRKRAATSSLSGIADHLHRSGYYAINSSFLYEPSFAYEGTDHHHFSNGETEIVIGNHPDGGLIAHFGIRQPSVAGRTPEVYRIKSHYNVYGPWTSGVPCHTTASIDDFKAVAKNMLGRMNDGRCGAACYTMYHGGDWHGGLRIGQYIPSTGNYHDSPQLCNGFSG